MVSAFLIASLLASPNWYLGAWTGSSAARPARKTQWHEKPLRRPCCC